MTITASFKACYLPILAAFKSKHDIRFYLNGFYIEPARGGDKGVYLAATDGHSLVVIHDASGEASEPGIFPIPDVLLKHCGAVKKKLHKAVFAERRIVIANGFATSTLGPIATEESISAAIAPIQGKFPDLRRVVNADFDKMPGTAVVTLNAQYIARLKKIGKLQSNSVPTQIRAADSSSSVYLLPKLIDHRILVIIMPMKDEVRKRPEWLSTFLQADEPTKPEAIAVDDTPSVFEQAVTGAAYFYPLQDMGIAA